MNNDIEKRIPWSVSFTLAHNVDIPGLKRFLEEPVTQGVIADTSPYVYIENPFRIMQDNEAGLKEKAALLAPLVGVLDGYEIEPVLIFDYTCMGDHHLTKEIQNRFAGMLAAARAVGIKSVQLAELYLARMLCCGNPPYSFMERFNVHLSPFAKINHSVKVNYLDTVEYKVLSLHYDVYNDFAEISRMSDAVGKDKVETTVNMGCFVRCPLETFCRAMRFHLLEEPPEEDEIESLRYYYQGKCSSWLRENPDLIGRMPLIKPSDLGRYVDLGVSRFRVYNDPSSVEDLYRTVMPYVKGENPDNVLTLIHGRVSGSR